MEANKTIRKLIEILELFYGKYLLKFGPYNVLENENDSTIFVQHLNF